MGSINRTQKRRGNLRRRWLMGPRFLSAALSSSIVIALSVLLGVPASGVGAPTLVVSAPVSAIVGQGLDVSAALTQDSAAISAVSVTFTAQLADHADVVATSTTDETGVAQASLVLPVRGSWTIVASYLDPSNNPFVSDPVRVTALGQSVSLTVMTPSAITSEVPFKTTVQVVTDTEKAPVAGVPVTLKRLATATQPAVDVGRATSDAQGHVTFAVSVWKTASLIASVAQTPTYESGVSATMSVIARPAFGVVANPVGAALPKIRFSDAPPAQGSGANPLIAPIPDSVWASMQGLTWHKGCMARSSLRYITVNYIGFDGFRYRGSIILASWAAKPAANVFSRLYAIKYPIRSMFLVDRYGKAPNSYPGANDYASMASDNTTGFNCRYVVGKETRRVMSPHASGGAIDINTWENPYSSPKGWYPNSWWVPRTRKSPAVLTWSSPAVKAFRAAGFSWGGSYVDYQHFDS